MTDQPTLDNAPAETFWIGSAIKALDGTAGRVGGYLVKFGLPHDAQGEYFMPDTNFHLDWYPGARPVLFHHGMGESEAEAIGHVYKLQTDDSGLWAEAELDLNIPVARQVYDEVRRGKIGWSSGSIPHLVKVEADGRIVDWPVVEASLTATPAAGKRTTVQAIKTELTAQPVEPSAKEAERDSGEVPKPESLAMKGVNEMTQDQLIAALEKAGIDSETILGIVKELSATPEAPAEMPEAVDAAPEDVPVEEDPNMMTEKGMQAMQDDKQAEIKAIIRAYMSERDAAKTAEPISKTDAVGARTAPAVVRPRSKWSHLSFEDLAFTYDAMKAAAMAQSRGGMAPWRPSSDMLREIAAKGLDAHREGRIALSNNAIKSLQVAAKANELNYSTQASYGDEFVPEAWRAQLWEKPRIDNVVAQNTVFIPMPSNPYKLPIESTDPTVYAVSETTAENQLTLADSNSPIPDSKVGTTNATLTAAKLALRVGISEELNEDSIIPVATLWRSQAVRAMEDARDNVLLNADATTGSSNINYSGSSITAGDKVLYGGGDGFFHLPLIDNTALAVSMGGATPTLSKIREARAKLGRAMISDLSNLVIYVDPLTYVKLLQVDELNVFMNNGQSATVLNGEVGRIDNIPVFVSNEIAQSSSTGVVSSTAASNTLGRLLIVHKPSWIAGYRREVRVNFDYIAAYDAWQLVVTMRMALARRSTDCAALLYNIAV